MSILKKKPAAKSNVTSSVKKTVKNVVKKVEKVVAKRKSAVEKIEKKLEKKAVSSAKKSVAKIEAKPLAKSMLKASSKLSLKKAGPKGDVLKSLGLKTVKKNAAKNEPAKKVAAKVKAAEKETVKNPVAEKVPFRNPETVQSPFSAEYLVLMQRDPNFLHAFWDVKTERVKEALAGGDKLVLRLYDISTDLTVLRNKNRKFRDIEIPADAKSWYVQNRGAVSCAASIGSVNTQGEFVPLVEAPAMQVFSFEGVRPSADNVFFKASLGTAGIGGFGSSGLSSPTIASWLERLASSSESFFSGALSSSAFSSGSLLQSPVDTVNYGKDFFLWVKTRLIVYGGTRPDAHLQVRGEPFPLNPDGTFSFEQDLPDSTQVIPVFATDKDGDFPTTIVPIVVKRTE